MVKPKSGSTKGRDGRPHATVADWNALKEQFKQQIDLVGNTREGTYGKLDKYRNGMVMRHLMNSHTELSN